MRVARLRCPPGLLVVLAAGLVSGSHPALGAPASAASVAIPPVELPAAGDAAWQPVLFPGIDAHTRYQAVEHEGSAVWLATSECAASGLAVALEDVDLERTPLLSWRWKVEVGPEPRDERARSGDDFAARVYVMFPFDATRASLVARARRGVAESVFGVSLPGHTLNYVWTHRARPPSHWPNPYAASNWMIALRSGRGPEWHSETVDLRADHRRIVGPLRSQPIGLAIMSDSDDSCGRSVAWFRDFRFHSADSPAIAPEVAH